MSPAVKLHGRAGTMKAPFGSTREVSISKVRHKRRCVRWKTYAGHSMTFGGFGFLLSKVLEGNYDLGEQKGPLRGLRQ